jgi:hypothetical protein
LLGQLWRDKENPPFLPNITSPGIAVAWPIRVGALMLTMVELSSLPERFGNVAK